MFDPNKVRRDFPIFQTKLSSGKPLVYLDSAATSQKPQAVLDAIFEFYKHDNANVHRGIHELGDRATKAWHQSRETIANFLGALPQELVMVRNTTEALNMVAYSWGEKYVKQGDILIATEMEHHSNLVPWQQLALRKGATLELIPVTKQGLLDLAWLERKLSFEGEKIKLVTLAHVSNTLGTINPVSEVVRLVRSQVGEQTIVVLDAAQSAPHMKVEFDRLDVDFMAVSAHKMLGPMGIGGLFVKVKRLGEIEPWLYGGGMIGEVYDTHASFAQDPEERLTAGTPDVAGAMGWATACEYLHKLGMEAVRVHDQEMITYTVSRLAQIATVAVVGPDPKHRSGSVTFLYQGVHAHDVAQILSSEGVAVRSGHHCTMPLHKHMGWAATTRVSFNVYTTKADIDVFVAALEKVKQVFA